MSVASRVGERYAKALVLEGETKGNLDEIYKDILFVRETSQSSRDLFLMFQSPIVKPETKEEIFNKLFKGKVSETIISFFRLVTLKGREMYLPQMKESFIEQYQEIKGIAKVHLTSATPLSNDAQKSITDKISASLGKTLEGETIIDSDLIGGVVVRHADKQLDLSVKTSLNRIKNNLAV